MKTTELTRKYWVDIAKGWAVGRLTDNIVDPGGSTPQLDEFNQVMDELLDANAQLAAAQAEIAGLVEALKLFADYGNWFQGFDPYDGAAEPLDWLGEGNPVEIARAALAKHQAPR